MKKGALSDYFIGVGTKVLRGTEVDPTVSRGHELQGVDDFRVFLGAPSGKQKIQVAYVWMADEEEPFIRPLSATWYDSRSGQRHRSPEYRLYYPAAAEEIVYRARAGDRLFLCLPKNGPLLALFCSQGTSIEQQLLWLFGLSKSSKEEIEQIDLRKEPGRELDIATRYVLELINVEVVLSEDEWLKRLLAKFKGAFPATADFSKFARDQVQKVDPKKEPDRALLEWMDLEERLFMTLERHEVGKRLQRGFVLEDRPDVDGFMRYSLSVQNRRKARAGLALGNHVEALLKEHGVRFKREATTEARHRPDFLFPGEVEYRDLNWPEVRLTMLAAKTSCKERWRQVLREADRIKPKHLLTLEPGISAAQTTDMKNESLQLVIPERLHESYGSDQRKELMSVGDFIDLVRRREES